MEKHTSMESFVETLYGKDSAKLEAFLFNFLGRLGFIVDDLDKRGLNLSPKEIIDMASRSKDAVGL